jgi:amino-acid N-acetyltransferase
MLKNLVASQVTDVVKNEVIPMGSEYLIRAAREGDFDQIRTLLKIESLPTDDLVSELPDFFVAEQDNCIIATIGLEKYGNEGLLRSMVVDRQYRNQSIAKNLLHALLKHATASGIQKIYLITTTAEYYFGANGFSNISREKISSSIAQTREFKDLCPSTATVMIKEL